jgi:histidinol-phosphatase (PHP family)
MFVDFHSHTFLCGHATGTPDEYIQSAIKKGIRIYGFSDHAPLPERLRENVTMSPDQTEEYIAMIDAKKREYRDRISIRIGFEVDFPLWDSFDKKYLTDPRLDYLIGSCHLLGEWPVDHSAVKDEYITRGIDNVWEAYFDNLLACASSGLFNIIGHFDLAKKFGYRPSKDFSAKIREIARAAHRTNTAVELNTSGLRKLAKEIYPSESIVKILFEENTAVTLGSDSHTPDDVGADFDKAAAVLRKIGYTKIASFEKRIMTLSEF